jgi:hypothetical protein
MPLAFAKLLYKASPMGMTVVITDLEELPRVAPTLDLLQSIAANAAAQTGPSIWQLRSIMATRCPCLASVHARYFDPSPLPIITRSYSSGVID